RTYAQAECCSVALTCSVTWCSPSGGRCSWAMYWRWSDLRSRPKRVIWTRLQSPAASPWPRSAGSPPSGRSPVCSADQLGLAGDADGRPAISPAVRGAHGRVLRDADRDERERGRPRQRHEAHEGVGEELHGVRTSLHLPHQVL